MSISYFDITLHDTTLEVLQALITPKKKPRQKLIWRGYIHKDVYQGGIHILHTLLHRSKTD